MYRCWAEVVAAFNDAWGAPGSGARVYDEKPKEKPLYGAPTSGRDQQSGANREALCLRMLQTRAIVVVTTKQGQLDPQTERLTFAP